MPFSTMIAFVFSLYATTIFLKRCLRRIGSHPPNPFPMENGLVGFSRTAYPFSARTPVAFSLNATEISPCDGIGSFGSKPHSPFSSNISVALL